jgi:hypothetical protein
MNRKLIFLDTLHMFILKLESVRFLIQNASHKAAAHSAHISLLQGACVIGENIEI